MMRHAMWLAGALVGLLDATACLSDAEAPRGGGASLEVAVAALNLIGVGDVVWDLQVVNGRQPTPDVVWQQRIASSRFGDGRGSVSYLGPCDASPELDQNTVRLWVVGVYAQPVQSSALGTFGAAPPAGAIDFQNPTPYSALAATWAAPLWKTTRCEANADAEVRFDVALMRPASQGFFDIAVNFNDVFCSAKFDCCVEDDQGSACARDLLLLHDSGGIRSTTMILGLACTAGPGLGVDTTLYLDHIELDCTSPEDGFAADIVIDPTRGPGNLCATAGDSTTCAGVSGASAGAHLFQVATYRGLEQLPSAGVPANKVYWNLALGVKRPAIASCRLRTRGTADAAGAGSVLLEGTIPAGTVYPYVEWDVDLASCMAEPLGFDVMSMVRTRYTATDGSETAFAHAYGATSPATSFCPDGCLNGAACLFGICACVPGFTGARCETNIDDCDGVGACAPGSCVDGIDAYTCNCPPGTFGSGTMSCQACDPLPNCAAATCESAATSTCAACESGYVLAEGQCVEPPPCGGVICPPIDGFAARCNDASHCEYARAVQTEPWHADDVWILVPPGSFPMGSPTTEVGRNTREGPVHTVTFAEGFLIGKYEVSARTYEACEAAASCTNRPLTASGAGVVTRTAVGLGDHPVNAISWVQAGEVCGWLGGRRPSEAEWEYAANGPTVHRVFPWGDAPAPTCAVGAVNAWFQAGAQAGCGTGQTSPVGSALAGASAVGAYDMAGNAGEWVEDCWHYDGTNGYTGAPTDGSAWTTSCTLPNRIMRSAGFVFGEGFMRLAYRTNGDVSGDPAHLRTWWGARCARTLP